MTKREQQILKGLRPICLALEGTEETVMFGHPTWRARGKTYCVLETYQGDTSICIKVGKSMQPVFLEDPRFYRTPYIGQHGWVSLKVDDEPDWEEVRELVAGSHQIATAKPAAKPSKRRV